MKMNEFDRLIRDKMNNLEPEYAPETWNLLEQKLDATEAGPAVPSAEEAIDELAFAKLHQFETAYNPDHWKTLSRRLDKEAVSRQEVLRYKLVELSLMLLLLFTLGQYLPFDQNKTTPQTNPEIPAVPTPAPHQNNSAEAATPQNKAIAASAASSNEQTLTSASLQNNNEGLPSPLAISEQTDSPISGKPEKQALNFLPVIPQNSIPLPKQDRIQGRIEPPQNAPDPVPGPARWAWDQQTLLAGLEALEIESLTPSLTEQSLEILPIAPRKKYNIRIGMQGSPDYDRIVTPPTEVDEDSIVSLDRYSLGYTGGLTLGVETGRWEVETGFFYAAKSYQPLSVLYVTGSVKRGLYGEGAKDFEFNTIYLPIKLRYNYLLKNNWRMFVSGGVAMHTVVQANYYLADQDGFRNALFAPAPVPQGEPQRPEQVERYDLNKGLFQGGGMWENTYFSANVGLGIERYVTGRLSIFSQANYAHSFYYPNGGIGPFLDRFHTTSLLMGIRVIVSD